MEFRQDIQGWRALAFLMVFVFHLNKDWWPGGFLGVDVFFVISGYLMTTIIQNKLNRNGFKFLDFLKSRFLRLVPAYFVLLLFVSVVGSYLYLSVDFPVLRDSLLSAIFFVSNGYYSFGESYFGALLNENPLLHTWSLSIEMQFYLLLPLIMIAFKKYNKYILLFLLVGLLVYSQFWMNDADGSSYFALIGRIPEFLVGSVGALFFSNGLYIKKFWSNVLSAITALLFILFSFLVGEEQFQIGFLSIIPCIAIGLMLVLKNSVTSTILSFPLLVWIGNLSYSLYLWHWPLIALIRYKYGIYELSTKQILFVIVMTLVFASLSYYLVEKRFKNFNQFNLLAIGGVGISIALVLLFQPILMKGKLNSEVYTKPVFGLKSHKFLTVEKFGDSVRNDSIFLFGDSNALMLKPFLNDIGNRRGFSFRTITCDGYLPLKGVKFEESDRSMYHMYEDSQSLVPLVEKEIEKAKFILLCTISYGSSTSVQNSIIKVIENLKPGQKLILINSFPYLDKDPIRINGGFVKKSDEVFKVSKRTSNLPFLKSVANNKNVFVYDLGKSDWFRTAPYVNDTVMYYNATHINTVGAHKLARYMEEDFMKFFNKVKEQP